MTVLDFPLLSKSEVGTPEVGSYKIFRDKDNGGLLTAKDSNCQFTVIAVSYVDSSLVHEISEKADKIIDDAGCALSKGIITAEQYESIVDNLNMCLDVKVDPVTGSYQACVTNTPTIFISLNLTHVLCNGGNTGTANATVTGGTAPYDPLVWQDLMGNPADPANLEAGSYTVTATDANGKNKIVSFIISEPPALSGTISATDETGPGANDGTATVVISGGTPPYTYLWDDGGAQTTATATGLAPGDYNCEVTDDNGCLFEIGPVTVS